MIEELMREEVKDIAPYVPGRRPESLARGRKALRMGSNENPLGPSPRVLRVLRNIDEDAIYTYPDQELHELREAVARYLNVHPENVILGNGSDEILDLAVKLFLKPGEEAVIPIPNFSMYESLTKLYSGKTVYVPLGKEFGYDVDSLLDKIGERTKMVFLSSPNNPTGSTISRGGIERILDRRVVVILDEAYVEFADGSLADLVMDRENLILIRTFSKAFGLAGLRIGYGIANEKVIRYMLRIKIPFSVNSPAQRAALTALKDKAYLEKTIGTVRKGRKFLYDKLSRMPGVRVYPSQGNFLLAFVPGRENIVDEMLRRGIIVRDCSTFRGLSRGYFRITVGTPEENKKFIDAMREILY